MSASSIWSRSNTSTPPLTAIRIVSQTNATAWWFFAKSSYFKNSGLLSGSSMSVSSATRPSLRAFCSSSYIIFKESM